MAYNPTSWVPGTFGTEITSARLNNIEGGIVAAVAKGELRINVADYASAVAAVAAAPAGSTVYFPPGTYTSPTGISNGIVVPADNITIEMSAGAEIRVPTWGQPGIDCYGRNGIRVVGKGTIKYTGTRGNHTGTTRGGATYTAGAGVYINGDRCEINGLRVIDMPTSVYLSSWDGSSLYGHRGQANTIRNVEFSGFNFGALYTAQDDLTLENIYGHDDVDDSSGANPTHVIYCSATATYRARGITVANLKARNLLYGQPYQWKYQDSGTITGLVSADSRGILNLHGCSDLEVTGVVTTGTKALLGAPHGAVTVQDTTTTRVKIRNVTIVADSAGLDQRLLYMYATDGVLENVQIISKRSSVDGVGIAQVVGDRMTVRDLTCIETGSAGVGLVVGDIANSLTSNDVRVEDVRLSGVLRGVDVWGTGSGSIRFTRGAISSSAEQVKRQTGTGGTGQYDVFRDNTLTTASSPEGVVTAPPGTIIQADTGVAYVKASGTGNTGWAANPKACNVQVFTSSGTWTKPAGAVSVVASLVGGGGGGGAGARGAAGTARSGGGGGGGGAVSVASFDASVLGSTETVTVGTGGAGAAAQTTNTTAGANGTSGGNTHFGNHLSARSGGGGVGGGIASAGTAGAGGIGLANGCNGGSGSATGAAGSSSVIGSGAGGGGGGGGITAADADSAGGSAQTPGSASRSTGTAGTTAGGSGGTGGASTTGTASPGGGGGGGGSSIVGAGGAGAAGAVYGGGGGGGGASLNGNNSGAGGAGANGIVVVVTYF